MFLHLEILTSIFRPDRQPQTTNSSVSFTVKFLSFKCNSKLGQLVVFHIKNNSNSFFLLPKSYYLFHLISFHYRLHIYDTKKPHIRPMLHKRFTRMIMWLLKNLNQTIYTICCKLLSR